MDKSSWCADMRPPQRVCLIRGATRAYSVSDGPANKRESDKLFIRAETHRTKFGQARFGQANRLAAHLCEK